jgi:hypothetical protein
MRLSSSHHCLVLLAVLGGPIASACHHSETRGAKNAPAQSDVSLEEDTTVHDAAWYSRAAVVNVDPGNSVTQRRSESTFSTRTSHANVDSHTSSLLVQVAALNRSLALKQPLLEQQLRAAGLQVTGQRRSKLQQPNNYNVLVEDVTYVEEVERKNPHDPIAYTIVPAVHVRVISANERTTIEGTAIAVKVYGSTLSADAADMYGKKLATARAELGKQLVNWLQSRLHPPQTNESAQANANVTGNRP